MCKIVTIAAVGAVRPRLLRLLRTNGDVVPINMYSSNANLCQYRCAV